jgi:hypothetical protein
MGSEDLDRFEDRLRWGGWRPGVGSRVVEDFETLLCLEIEVEPGVRIMTSFDFTLTASGNAVYAGVGVRPARTANSTRPWRGPSEPSPWKRLGDRSASIWKTTHALRELRLRQRESVRSGRSDTLAPTAVSWSDSTIISAGVPVSPGPVRSA